MLIATTPAICGKPDAEHVGFVFGEGEDVREARLAMEQDAQIWGADAVVGVRIAAAGAGVGEGYSAQENYRVHLVGTAVKFK